MNESEKILGVSKVAVGMKISLIKEVAKRINAKESDLIVFKQKNDRIYIEKG